MKAKIFKKVLTSTLFAILLLLPLSLSNSSFVMAEEDDDEVDGVLSTQNFNNAATISDFNLVSTAAITTGSSLTPQLEYTVEIEVNDPDSIRDLRSLEIRFFNSTETGITSPSSLEADFNENPLTDNTGDSFVVRWERFPKGANLTKTAFSVTHTGFSNFSTESSWELSDTQVVPETSTHFNQTSFQFEFTFTISKVAPQSVDDLRWYFGSIVEDGLVSLDSDELDSQDPRTTDYGLEVGSGGVDEINGESLSSYWLMDFYGEVSIADEDNQVIWEDIPAGTTFGAVNANASITGINYISNGLYDSRIESSEIWEAVMTASLAAILLEDFSSTDFGVFQNEYDEYRSINPELSLGVISFDDSEDFAGLTYNLINTIADEINTGEFSNFKVLLPESSPGVNQTGAALTENATDSAIAFDDIVNTSDSQEYEQYFAIGYDFAGVDAGRLEQATPSAFNSYYLVGHSQARSFGDEESPNRLRTLEAGKDFNLELYLTLSEIFQNARYEGTLTLKVVNFNPEQQ